MGGKAGAGASQTPKVKGIQVQSSLYGTVIPLIYGQNRVAGNLIWYGNLLARLAESVGGKGMGGGKEGGGQQQYSASVLISLGEGILGNIVTIWSNKERHAPSDFPLNFQSGTYTQSPLGWLSTWWPDQALNYPGIAYAGAAALDLGTSPTLPNITFEMAGKLQNVSGKLDANPAEIMEDLLTNYFYGAGFPSARLAALTNYSNYCLAAGLLLSPALTEQKEAAGIIKDLLELTNSEAVWSEGELNIVPYGDEDLSGNGATYTAPSAPLYDLDDDDFISGDDQDPVRLIRARAADRLNVVRLEYLNRAKDYTPQIAEAKDQAGIELYGLRCGDPKQAHAICDSAVARNIAQLILQREGIRNEYEFSLDWRYIVLDPMDIVSLTDANLGLDRQWVRILEIEEDEDGQLQVKAEGYLAGTGAAAEYDYQEGEGYAADYNADPGLVNAPVMFEPPVLLSGDGLELWAAISGASDLWGGCDIYVSLDEASYKLAGRVTGKARTGLLAAALAASSISPDGSHTLSVDLSQSGGELLSGTQEEADLLATLCYCDGELLAYQTATLTGATAYDLTYLVRGAYGTAKAAHLAGTRFARLDSALFKYPFGQELIGKTIALKFISFNVFGAGLQNLADIEPHYYTITGQALNSPLSDVQNLTVAYSGNQAVLSWDAVTDPSRTVDYEIRMGTAWMTAKVLGRTPVTNFAAQGDGTYWVSAHSGLAYSSTPASVVIEGATLVRNVVATWDEEATGWSGTLSGGAAIDGGNIVLAGTGLVEDMPDVEAVEDFVYYGAVESGGYEIPASHIVDIGEAAACAISAVYEAYSADPYSSIEAAPDFEALASVGGEFAGLSNLRVQVAVAGNDEVFGDWQDLMLGGQYVGRKFELRLLISTTDPTVTVIVTAFAFTVDMPDRVERGTNVACEAGGLSVTFARAFQVAPNVQITVLSATAGDDVVLATPTTAGFSVQIKNGGSGVARDINWFAQGY